MAPRTKRSARNSNSTTTDLKNWEAERKKIAHDLADLKAGYKELKRLLKNLNHSMKKGQTKRKNIKKHK